MKVLFDSLKPFCLTGNFYLDLLKTDMFNLSSCTLCILR